MKPDAPKDPFGRPLRSLRISVTDRCNYRCRYCLPEELFGPDFQFLPRSEILTFEEITTLAGIFVELGVESIRITGGEPLLRRDLDVLIQQLRNLGNNQDLSLTTNGTRLGPLAEAFRNAGLNRINVSMDAVDPEVARKVAGTAVDVGKTWKNVLAARDLGLPVKINAVIIKGLNEDQILPLAGKCREEGINLRFIEYMDVGTSNGWSLRDVVTGEEVRRRIHAQWPLVQEDHSIMSETAKRYRYEDGTAEVGFINSISEPFCKGCDRARISAEGSLYTCLFASKGIPLKHWLREEKLGKQAILDRLREIWSRRNDRYSELRSEESGGFSSRPEMWTIGG